MKYNLNYLGTYHPDYFGGHHLPVVQVVTERTTTYGDLKESLLDNWCTDHIEELDEEAYKLAVHTLFEGIELEKIPSGFSYIEEQEQEPEFESFDSIYSFFAIETVEEGDDE